MLLQLAQQIVLPIFLLTMLWRSRAGRRRDWGLNTVVTGLALLFVFLTARWDWFSYSLRFLIIPFFGAAAYFAYRKIGTQDTTPGQWQPLANTAIVFVLVWLNAGVIRGYFYPGQAVELSFPLRNGTYYIGGGGSSPWINGHRADEASGNDFALDIVRLNALGNRADGLEPGELAAYDIFGAAVYSPCSGTVMAAVDGLPDQTPPAQDDAKPAGNHIIIACEGIKIVLAHMKRNSLLVKSGDAVSEGQPIGQVGNSGATSQPHLHIHAAEGGANDGILDGSGIPILLDGQFLIRNSLFAVD